MTAIKGHATVFTLKRKLRILNTSNFVHEVKFICREEYFMCITGGIGRINDYLSLNIAGASLKNTYIITTTLIFSLTLTYSIELCDNKTFCC